MKQETDSKHCLDYLPRQNSMLYRVTCHLSVQSLVLPRASQLREDRSHDFRNNMLYVYHKYSCIYIIIWTCSITNEVVYMLGQIW